MDKEPKVPMSELRAAWAQYQKTGIVPGTTELNMLKRQNATMMKKSLRLQKKMVEVSRVFEESEFFMKLFWRIHIFRSWVFEKECLKILKVRPKNFLGIYYIPCKK